ncbi:Chromosomal replication initiator protein DnaA 1 [Candidatus Neptunochlamydia vexilliferae]|uniref:Chromosomal replication initiator protein DnaA n=2 Tax=Candidatus Neptunichlamydia vexilliferae TaxID=1651774 RepID=A0ABS0AYW8_9BACT|nr:Chromosomal replication initiator protein DnaA 1 [Candidatus Neptunochlamydia vexilliferae]
MLRRKKSPQFHCGKIVNNFTGNGYMSAQIAEDVWSNFVSFMENRCSRAEFENWIAPIEYVDGSDPVTLQVPNVFVQQYLLDNYKETLNNFFPKDKKGEPLISFLIKEQEKQKKKNSPPPKPKKKTDFGQELFFNTSYTFENFIEGPSNQFIKSAALGVASRPGKSYNPLFIHGGVGLGKTHLLHGIGHYVKKHHPKLKIQCITTEAFISDLVHHLRNKSVDKMKRYYRNLDILLVDDIQFLQNRLNFEEEFCNMFEALINQNNQIVVTSDKPPGQLQLSERMVARMEWGLVAHIGTPDLETRVAILQYKAEQTGLHLPSNIAFYIAEHIYNNVRQLEGAINRLGAYCRLMNLAVSKEVVDSILSEMFQAPVRSKISIDRILHSVASMFNVRESDLRGSSRTKEIAYPRQIAMYLAKELLGESLVKIASSFGGKTHSTLLHAWKKISAQLEKDDVLRRQVQMTRQNIEA